MTEFEEDGAPRINRDGRVDGDGGENGADWLKWKTELRQEVPVEVRHGLRLRLVAFHEANRLIHGTRNERSEPVHSHGRYGWKLRVPRWLGYAGTAIAVLAACVVTILVWDHPNQSPLDASLIDHDLIIAEAKSVAYPSMMVSLTSPRNSIQSSTNLRNPSFEEVEFRDYQPDSSQPIPGWFFPSHCKDAGYRVETDPFERCEGRRSAVIDCRVEQPGLMGNLMQTLSATKYRNKTIRLTAALRADVPVNGGQVQMWLRIDNDDATIGFFDNMDDRPVRTNDWQYAAIQGRVPQNAEFINVGAFLIGSGTAWLDDFQLEVVDF
jgi:hypothetical protein